MFNLLLKRFKNYLTFLVIAAAVLFACSKTGEITEHKISDLGKKIGRLKEKKEAVNKLISKDGQLKQALSKFVSNDSRLFMKDVRSLAYRTGIDIVSIRPSYGRNHSGADAYFSYLRIRLKGNCSYKNLVRFLKQIENYGRFIRVEKLNLQPGSNNPRNYTGILSVDIEVVGIAFRGESL